MNNANVELIVTCNAAKGTWDKLLSVYEQSSGHRIDRLFEQFFSTTKNSTKDIATYIARLKRKLKRQVKCDLPDLLLMSRIMSTLPHENFSVQIL